MLRARVDVSGLPVWPSLLITGGRVLFCVNVVQAFSKHPHTG